MNARKNWFEQEIFVSFLERVMRVLVVCFNSILGQALEGDPKPHLVAEHLHPINIVLEMEAQQMEVVIRVFGALEAHFDQ